MKTSALIYCLIIVAHSVVCGQQTTKTPLQFESSMQRLNVTPDGQLSIASRAGEVAINYSTNDTWQKIDILPKESSGLIFGLTLDNIDFFNKDTGFVSGFINNNGKYNIIYRTQNGGKTWKPVDFGMDGWVDVATHLDNGEAWLSVGGKGIAYSKDFGTSWTGFSFPAPKQRFLSIFFNDSHQGIIGSLWNMIAITSDNCQHWSIIPTPLDQKKYRKTNLDARPEINNVGLFKNFYLVQQEGMVFYSKKDSINWIPVPALKNFYTDAKNSALFFLTNQSTIVKANDDLQVIVRFDSIQADNVTKVKNGNLYILYGPSLTRIHPDNSVQTAMQYCNSATDNADDAFFQIGYSSSGYIYSVKDGNVYLQMGYKGNRQVLFQLPFAVQDLRALSIVNDNTLLYANNDSLLYYNMDTKKIEHTTVELKKKSFLEAGIREIVFEKGSLGCFHYYNDRVVYNRKEDAFETDGLVNSSGEHTVEMQSDGHPIEAVVVDSFVTDLLQQQPTLLSITDLGFTNQSFARCKKEVMAFQAQVEQHKKRSKDSRFQLSENNIDFPTLIAMTDSLANIKPHVLANYLATIRESLGSTTTNWIQFTFTNQRNEKLTVRSFFSYPNAFYFPWTMQLAGISNRSADYRINRFLETVYPDLLEHKNDDDLLYDLVIQLYHDHL